MSAVQAKGMWLFQIVRKKELRTEIEVEVGEYADNHRDSGNVSIIRAQNETIRVVVGLVQW